MTVQTPIVNDPNKYVQGLNNRSASTTLISLDAGAARDSSNTNDIVLDSPVTLDTGVVGVNGLDTGTIGAASGYAIYVIGDSTKYNPTAGIISLSEQGPSLPRGYDMFRRVGWFRTSASLIVGFEQTGAGQARLVRYDGVVNLTTTTVTSFTTLQTSSNCPSAVSRLYLQTTYTPALAASYLSLRPVGSTSALGDTWTGSGVAAIQRNVISTLTNSSGNFEYKAFATDVLSLDLSSFEDYLL